MNTSRSIVIGVMVSTFLFCAALGGFLWWYLGNEEDAVRDSSAKLAAAIERNDPGAAPEGASEYVGGVNGYFGPVKQAKLVDARKVDNHSQNSSTADDRSWWVSTIFLRSERGAALLLVTFDSSSIGPGDQRVSDIRELAPKKVAKGALTAEELADARAAFASRGDKTADSLTLDGSRADMAETKQELADLRRKLRDKRRAARRNLPPAAQCVQDAAGDVEKMQRC